MAHFVLKKENQSQDQGRIQGGGEIKGFEPLAIFV